MLVTAVPVVWMGSHRTTTQRDNRNWDKVLEHVIHIDRCVYDL